MIAIIATLSVLLCVTTVLCFYFRKNRIKENLEIKQKNIQEEKHLHEIEELCNKQNNQLIKSEVELKNLETQKQNIQVDINNSQEISKNAFSRYNDSLQDLYIKAEDDYDKLILQLKTAYENKQELLYKQTEEQRVANEKEIEEIKEELNKLKETRAAALEAQRREELLKQTKDDYRVILNENELSTIEILNEIKSRLPDQRILYMLIWQSFYQKKLSALCKKLLGNKVICGIYKITNIKNNMCYIGQSKDIETRWANHMKAGLGIDTPVGNKLYLAMKEIGPENFTFELLEVCPAAQLNEKEKFYIDLYQSKDFGYNSTAGNK